MTVSSWCKLSAQLLLVQAVVISTAVGQRVDWVQLRAVISYTRAGTSATAREGKFVFSMHATLDQVMVRVKPRGGETLPAYYVNDDYETSIGLGGEATLEADVTQEDGPRTYTATAVMRTELRSESDLQLKEVKPAGFFGPGLLATFTARMHLRGVVKSDYPRMPGVEEADHILLWPTPVKFDADEGFVSEGEHTIFPVLGERPGDEQLAMLYDMTAAKETLPGLGGFRPPGVGATTEGQGDQWIFRFKTQRTFELGTGGVYTDTITVEIQPVPLTLPLPGKRPQ